MTITSEQKKMTTALRHPSVNDIAASPRSETDRSIGSGDDGSGCDGFAPAGIHGLRMTLANPTAHVRASPSTCPMPCSPARAPATGRRSSSSTAGSSGRCSPWRCASAATARRRSDVLQDTMLKVLGRIGEFRGGGSPFWGWLRQIAVNEALMRLRRDQAPGAGDRVDDTSGSPKTTAPLPARRGRCRRWCSARWPACPRRRAACCGCTTPRAIRTTRSPR